MMSYLTCFVTVFIGLYPGCGLGAATPPDPAPGVMQCYTGNCTTFKECRRPELVQDCPDPYDACITEIVQKAHGRLTIEKKCGMSPCSQSELDWWGDECDRKSDDDSYSCTSCCASTLCNSAPPPSHAPLALALALATLCCCLASAELNNKV